MHHALGERFGKRGSFGYKTRCGFGGFGCWLLFLTDWEGSPPFLEEVETTIDAELVSGDLFSATAAFDEFLVHCETTLGQDQCE